MIALDPVESSQIHAVGFDPATGVLAIQFKNKSGPGNVYHYANFSQSQYNDFVAAESIGKYFGQNIKGNPDHPHQKIEQAADEGEPEAA